MEERMMILKMLQEGKISAEEALRLLETFDKTCDKENTKYDSTRNKKKAEDNLSELSEKAERIAEQFGDQFGANTEKLADDFSKRIESVSTDIANAAVKLTDKMMKYFNTAANAVDNKFELVKTYSFEIEDIDNLEIGLNASNFSVKVDGADTNLVQVNVLANSFIQDVLIDDCFNHAKDGAKLNFFAQFPNRTWGKIDLTVPKKLLSICINTTNAKCELSNISGDTIKVITANGKIDMTTCAAHHVEALTDNARIDFERCGFTSVSARTSNGKIDFTNCRIDEMTAKTSNASIALSGLDKLNDEEGKYTIHSSNGKIDIEITPDSECGYIVDAHTTMGKINIDLPNLSYTVDKKEHYMNSTAAVKSTNYDAVSNKLGIKAETSNASINIKRK